MGIFEDLILRENGDTVDSSWWNSLTAALRSALPNFKTNYATPFTLVNDQSTYADITGAIFLATEATSWLVRYEVYRKTDSTERLEFGQLVITYKPIAISFAVNRFTANDEDAMNIDDAFFVTALGQLQYKTDNMSGASYVGKFSYTVTNVFKGGL